MPWNYHFVQRMCCLCCQDMCHGLFSTLFTAQWTFCPLLWVQPLPRPQTILWNGKVLAFTTIRLGWSSTTRLALNLVVAPFTSRFANQSYSLFICVELGGVWNLNLVLWVWFDCIVWVWLVLLWFGVLAIWVLDLLNFIAKFHCGSVILHINVCQSKLFIYLFILYGLVGFWIWFA